MINGKNAFRAYSLEMGDKTWEGKPIPPWDKLGPAVQAGWRAVEALSRAVIAENIDGLQNLEDDEIASLVEEYSKR